MGTTTPDRKKHWPQAILWAGSVLLLLLLIVGCDVQEELDRGRLTGAEVIATRTAKSLPEHIVPPTVTPIPTITPTFTPTPNPTQQAAATSKPTSVSANTNPFVKETAAATDGTTETITLSSTLAITRPTPIPITMLPPTAIPAFPQQAIRPETLPNLVVKREIGYGKPHQGRVAPAGTMLAVATSAGIAWFDRATLRHVRFDAIDGGVDTLVFRPDGQQVAATQGTGSTAHTLLLQTSSGQQQAVLEGQSPTFSPDGQYIATVRHNLESGETTTILWNTRSGERQGMMVGHSPDFSLDGALVVTIQTQSEGQPAILVWRSRDGALLRDMVGWSPIFSPVAPLLAIANEQGIQILRVPDLDVVHTRDIESGGAILRFSDDGQRLLVLAHDGLRSWHITSDNVSTSLAVAGTFSTSGTSPTSSNTLVQIGGGGEGLLLGVRLISADDGRVLYENPDALFTDPGYAHTANLVTFGGGGGDGSTAVFVTVDGWVWLIDLDSGTPTKLPMPWFSAVAFHPDGLTLATARIGPAVDLWRLVDGSLLRQFPADWGWSANHHPDSAFFAPGGIALAVEATVQQYGAFGAAITTWDMVSQSAGREVWSMSILEGTDSVAEHPLAYNPAGGMVAWVDERGAVQLRYNTTVTDTVPTAPGGMLTLTEPGAYSALEFNPDGSLLAVGDAGGRVQLLKTDSGYLYDAVNTDNAIRQIIFSPDGSLVGALRDDGLLLVWPVGQQTPMAQAIVGAARRVVFSGDNQMAIAAGSDGVAWYSLSNGQLLYSLVGPADDVAFDAGQRLLAVLHGGRVTVWGVR